MKSTIYIAESCFGKVFLLLFLALAHSCGAQEEQPKEPVTEEGIELVIVGNSISLRHKDKIRLSGGHPLFQNLTPELQNVEQNGENQFSFQFPKGASEVGVKRSSFENIIGLYLNPQEIKTNGGTDFAGLFFAEIPEYKTGVAYWRYKPWNSWTKPMKVPTPAALESWDVQCYYWMYNDSTYGAAIPLGGHGYRATLGSEKGSFGSKAVSYVPNYQADTIPALAVGFGDNPYILMGNLYEAALGFMGEEENLQKKKNFPEALEYLGWCTWNASDNGSKLNEKTILQGVESFTQNGFPLGFLLIDDGWFNHENRQLQSLFPDPKKFPDGFKPLINKLKSNYGLKHVGVWHALNGYWNGIDPVSDLSREYKKVMFSWEQKISPVDKSGELVTFHFIKPTTDSLALFFDTWHSWMKEEGFTFLKVDNQLVVEKMSVDNFPIWDMAKATHKALNQSAQKHFNGTIINCMNMTTDAFYHFGSTPVGRSVEDYFPYEEGETYDLQKGNAAAHVLQAIYNSLYFSQMVYPDFDMFQSHHPHAEFHAIARAINNGPIYITDNVGQQNFELLYKLIDKNGKILRSTTSLLPAEDCLFQVQEAKPFKAFSYAGDIGLLGVWNCADADEVLGVVKPTDVAGMKGENFVLYESISGKLQTLTKDGEIPVSLNRMGYQLYYVAPLQHQMAPLGLLNKYNAPATILDYSIDKKEMRVTLLEAGLFGAVLPRTPAAVHINGNESKNFTFENGMLKVNIPEDSGSSEVDVVIKM